MRITLVKNNEKKAIRLGQDFVALFFGFISPLLKKDIIWAIVFFLIQILTIRISYVANLQLPYVYIFAQVFMGSMYNSIYVKSLLKKGWIPETEEDQNKLLQKGFISSRDSLQEDDFSLKNEIATSSKEPIEYRIPIEAKIKKIAFSFVFLAVGTFLFWIFLTEPMTEIEKFVVIFTLMGCIFLFLTFVHIAIKDFQNKFPTLVIKLDGVVIETNRYHLGYIPWSEIEAIKVMSTGNNVFMCFELVHKEVFIEKYKADKKQYKLLKDELINKERDSINLSSLLFPVTIDTVYEETQTFFIPYLEKNRL